jgi:hypothetical protein
MFSSSKGKSPGTPQIYKERSAISFQVPSFAGSPGGVFPHGGI